MTVPRWTNRSTSSQLFVDRSPQFRPLQESILITYVARSDDNLGELDGGY